MHEIIRGYIRWGGGPTRVMHSIRDVMRDRMSHCKPWCMADSHSILCILHEIHFYVFCKDTPRARLQLESAKVQWESIPVVAICWYLNMIHGRILCTGIHTKMATQNAHLISYVLSVAISCDAKNQQRSYSCYLWATSADKPSGFPNAVRVREFIRVSAWYLNTNTYIPLHYETTCNDSHCMKWRKKRLKHSWQ